jgi:hypothetical protein
VGLEFGFQDKKKTYALLGLAVLLVFAGLYAINNMPSDESAAASAVAPAANPGSKPAAAPQTAAEYRRRRQQEAVDIYAIDPTIHVERLEHAADSQYEATKRGPFRYVEAPPPPPPPKTTDQLREEARIRNTPPPPPPPPPIDLKYYGYSTDSQTKAKKIFLTDGQEIYIAVEGEVVANRYRILHVGVNSIEVEDMRTKSRQILPLIES